MLSEEPVQVEGVEALLNLSKQYIPKEQAQNLVLKVIQVIMDRISPQSEHQEMEDVKEKAKIAILIIVQKFADADVFEKEQCQNFLDNHLEDIQDGMLFKIKKFVMPALIAVSKHLTPDVFLEKVYKGTFQQFNNDEIWGVRKVCIENLASLMKFIPYDDVQRITECIEFLNTPKNSNDRLLELTIELSAYMLTLSNLEPDLDTARIKSKEALDSGKAASIFGEMVSELGGPSDLMENPEKHLKPMPIIGSIQSNSSGYISEIDVRAVGVSMIHLKAGRTKSTDSIDHGVGLSEIVGLGQWVNKGDSLAIAHCRNKDQLDFLKSNIPSLIQLSENMPKVQNLIKEVLSSNEETI